MRFSFKNAGIAFVALSLIGCFALGFAAVEVWILETLRPHLGILGAFITFLFGMCALMALIFGFTWGRR